MDYTVRNRDTLTSIASRFGMSVDELVKANGIKNPNHLAIGQHITIPGDQDEFTGSVTASSPGARSPATSAPRTASTETTAVTPQYEDQQPSLLKQLWNDPRKTLSAGMAHLRAMPAAGEAATTPAGGQGSVHIQTPWYLQTQGGHGFTPGKRECFQAASAMARAAGGRVLPPGSRIEVASSKDRNGNITVNPAGVARGRARIDSELAAGRPVVVGVAHNHGRYNVDHMTDHFVTITGRGTDAQGRTYYSFNDPGTRNGQDTSARNRFYVDPRSGELYRPKDPLAVGLQSQRYQVTMVR